MSKKGVNRVTLIGNLGKDPESRFLPSGGAVSNFTIATSESWKDKNTGQDQERTEWHRIAVFGKLAEICNEYLRKGSKVYIEGSLRTNKWQNQAGEDRYTTEIVATEMQMLDSRGSNDGQVQGQQNQAQPQSHYNPEMDNQAASKYSLGSKVEHVANNFDDFDDDIPF